MDVSQYLEIFIDETKEHLQSLNEQLLIIEKEPDNEETINEIFRVAHTIKGMAGTMGYKRMQHLTHIMENVLSEIRNGKMKIDAGLIDVLFRCLDALEKYIDNVQSNTDEGTDDNEPIINQLNDFLNNNDPAKVDKTQETEKQTENTKADETNSVEFTKLSLAEFEKHAINEAMTKGLNVFGIKVTIDETCILKAARAFLVFKTLEEKGEVIKSEPSVQDIEDEKFDFSFTIYLITKEKLESITNAIKAVSEIKEALGVAINQSDAVIEEPVKEEENEKEEAQVQVANTSEAPAAPQQTTKAPAAKSANKPVVNRSVRVDIEKLDVLMNLVSELIIAKNGLVSVSNNDQSVSSQGFNEQIEYLERVTTNLHESVMKVRMMPIETVTNKFPRMIRDLSKNLNKRMELTITGEDTELDRTVIDEIGDPLMHLLRNSADHGLENDELRKERGKSSVGQIFLNAYQDGNNVVIEVGDDGNGINIDVVKAKAIEKGTVTAEQAETMNDKDFIDLLFKPSFSTAKTVSDVSGRGVGLDVVKTKIEALGGDIEVKTKLGEGSTFVIHLPLTLAIIQALMVELGNEKYAISLNAIQTIEDISIDEIKYVQTREVINLRGTVIPIVRLDKALDVESQNDEEENLTVVIVKKGDKLAGLVVDKLIGQQEIVIKSLGKYISNANKIIGGATILGDGEVALILDVNSLV